MPTYIRKLAMWVTARVPTLLTLIALGGLALWGQHNDWRLSPSRGSEEQTKKQTNAEPAVTVLTASASAGSDVDKRSMSAPVRIEFPSVEAVTKVGIQVVPVKEQALTQFVTAPGMVDYDPEHYTRLTARTPGSIVRVNKEIGDPVRKGELLAVLDAAEVGRIKAEFLQDLAQVKLRSAALERLQKGYKEGAMIPERSLQEAQTAVREARIRLVNDQQALLNLGLQVHLEDLEKLPDDGVARRLRFLGLPEALVRDLNAETLSSNLLPLTAPFDGQVVERNVAVGEVVQTTQPKTLFIVANVRRLHVDIDVNPEDMALVRVGQRVTFRPNDGGPEAVGRVSHISPEVNEKTRRVQVHAQVRNEDGRLRPNTFGTGQVILAERPRAAAVPGEAVHADGHTSVVFIRIAPTQFEARPVHLGLRQGNLVELSGVREGEEVVTRGSYLLKSELQKDRIAGGDE